MKITVLHGHRDMIKRELSKWVWKKVSWNYLALCFKWSNVTQAFSLVPRECSTHEACHTTTQVLRLGLKNRKEQCLITGSKRWEEFDNRKSYYLISTFILSQMKN